MGKSIGTDNGTVGLDQYTGDHGYQAGGGIDTCGINTRCLGKEIGTGVQGHDHLFHGGVSGPFSNTVDGNLHLACPVFNGSQGV